MLPGMAYLVRRLLENTSNESFLKNATAGRSMIDADIAGELTRIIFEVDANKDLVIVIPVTAFPAED